MNKLLLLVITMLSCSLYAQHEIIIDITDPRVSRYDMTDEFCAALIDPLVDEICFRTQGTRRDIITVVINDCVGGIVLEDKTISIPNLFTLEVSNTILVTGENSKIEGDNINGSKIFLNSTHRIPAVYLDGCDDCELTDISIIGNEDNDGDTGIIISPSSPGCDIESVSFRELNTGIKVVSNGNYFSGLDFHKVATDNDDCDADIGDGVGLWLCGVDGNVLENLIHTRSPGAITLRIDTGCKNNVLQGISLEQEGTHCGGGTVGDPSIFFNDIAFGGTTGNVIIANMHNVGLGLRGNDCAYCFNNTLNILEDNNAGVGYCGDSYRGCNNAATACP